MVALAKEGATESAQMVVESHVSLAGASGKVGLYREPNGGGWFLPTGTAPSTHIVKQGHVRYDDYRYDLNYLRDYMVDWMENYGSQCWMSLFYNNHDNPRMVSKVDPAADSDPILRRRIQTLLAVLQFTLRGTPFVYQGQELGMLNNHLKDLNDFKDVVTFNNAKLFKRFGFQSGRNVDKFGNLQCPTDCNGIPYMNWQACAVISGKVVESHDLGSHTLFIAEVVDAKVLSENPPLTYADYQANVKPKADAAKADAAGADASKAGAQQEKKIVGWRCKICNYVYEGSELPADFSCPLCGHGPEDFEPVYETN